MANQSCPPPLYGCVDGFTLNSRVLNAISYFQNVLAQLEPLRRANGYRMRMWGVPDPQDLPIPAFESVEYQIQCQPGAYLWGFNFYASAGTSQPASAQPINSIRITDGCTQLPLADKPTLAVAYSGTLVGGGVQAFGLGQNRQQVMLPQPYLVAAPGLMNVEVTNGSPYPSQCQLLLMFAEPCINEKELERLIKRLR